MRTVNEIKLEMTSAFMADVAIRAKYDPANAWTNTTTFDDVFARVSIESILFYVVAVISYGLEFLLGKHVEEVAAMETRMRVGSKEWWRQLCYQWQYGDSLVFDATTNIFKYAAVDETAKILKYVDVKENAMGLAILVAEADNNGDAVIMNDAGKKAAFEVYIRKTKIAGVPITWDSFNPDTVKIALTVIYDPLVMNASGELIVGGTKPVDLAVGAYLKNIPYGSGVMNKTQIIDAIQKAEGVVDVYPDASDWLQVYNDFTGAYTAVSGQNAVSYGGSFSLDTLTISYDV